MGGSIYDTHRSGIFAAVDKLVTGWALLGGLVVLAVVLMNVWTVISAFSFWETLFPNTDIAFAGDVELTKIGIAVAAFAFLPYCQISNANVTADIFTSRASAKWIAIFGFLASLVALLFSVLLTYSTYGGLQSQQEYGYTTAILQVPIWYSYIPAVISLALLSLASCVTLVETFRNISSRGF